MILIEFIWAVLCIVGVIYLMTLGWMWFQKKVLNKDEKTGGNKR